MSKSQMTTSQVKHIAKLANIPVSDQEAQELAAGFDEVLGFVANLKELETSTVDTTHQVTGLENILRQDTVNETTMFTQAQALANASRTYNGYFVVPRIIDND